MTKIRLSYSLINNVIWGRYDDVVKQYLKIPTPTNVNMERGLIFDKMVEEVANTKCMFPEELGSHKLVKPVCKLTATVDYSERFTLKGELDLYDEPAIIEIKNSETKDSMGYSETGQLDFYFLLSELSEKDSPLSKADRAWLFRFDPIHRTYDSTLVWKTQKRIDNARNMLDTYGPKVYEILKNEGIIND